MQVFAEDVKKVFFCQKKKSKQISLSKNPFDPEQTVLTQIRCHKMWHLIIV